AFCRENGYVAFVADGSILPRKGDSEEPLETAVPFVSPERLRVTVPMEDGRSVANEDISMIFSDIPFQNIRDFTTKHASGSISQAANIIESIAGGSRLLTIDEDKSATNFMIRDELMRKIVKDEVIIPFTDRIRSITEQKGVSTILVIGGSGEYLKIADTVILMHEYVATDVTDAVKVLNLQVSEGMCPEFTERERTVLLTGEGTKSLLLQTVCTEDSKKVICGEYSVDMTAISSLKTNEQLHSLAWVLRSLLSKEEKSEECLNSVGEEYTRRLFVELENEQRTSNPVYRGWWFDEIRKEEILMCVNRARGLCFGGCGIDK
ncbi:MAG: hypothetical protein IJX95_11525, partial [Lachnospiraceae bacterium]|nr:hypothetical protein [Lachnospiraceae bacterium]